MKNNNYFKIDNFKDGSLVLSCGKKGMESDLVFASSAMNGDPSLREQKDILDFILKAIKNYNTQYDVENFTVKQAKEFFDKITSNQEFSLIELTTILSDLLKDNERDKNTILDLQTKLGIKQQEKKS